jgi:uncharacterized protein with HEPN domain
MQNWGNKKLILLAPLLPFTIEKADNFPDELTGHLDQYVFRFSKLQDAIGQKLFKGLLLFLGEETYNKPFLDIFNRLEQLGIIENYDLWNELRIIRNEIAHEYDENKHELIEKLNKIINSKDKLEKYLLDVIGYLKNRE